MTTRSQREQILRTKLGASLAGLREEPGLTATLNALDRADSEGLNQMVEALLSEVNRSGSAGGFLLELDIAVALFNAPQPRTLACEKQEGTATVPGDIWLDFNSCRYEFQCKHMKNWSVELWVTEATDRIERDTAYYTPGRFYELKPGVEGTRQDWQAFADWVIEKHREIPDGIETPFGQDGRHVGTIAFRPAAVQGLSVYCSWSPGWIHVLDVQFLRCKLGNALKVAKKSFSAVPSSTQINCLVIEIDDYLIGRKAVFNALYGQEYYTFGHGMEPHMGWDANGLWPTDTRWDALSAVVWPKLTGREPLAVSALVYPNPKRFAEIQAAFAPLTNFKVIEHICDVLPR